MELLPPSKVSERSGWQGLDSEVRNREGHIWEVPRKTIIFTRFVIAALTLIGPSRNQALV